LPAVGASLLDDELGAILANQQDADAGQVRAVDVTLGVDDVLVAFGQITDRGGGVARVGVARQAE
jgi:hypothetical protein